VVKDHFLSGFTHFLGGFFGTWAIRDCGSARSPYIQSTWLCISDQSFNNESILEDNQIGRRVAEGMQQLISLTEETTKKATSWKQRKKVTSWRE